MIQVPLDSVPNQAVSMVLGQNVYDISVRYASSVDDAAGDVIMSVSVNDNVIVSGQRCVSHVPMFWADGIGADDNSNFVWLCSEGSYPAFEGFGTSGGCSLVWVTESELAELRATANVI